RPRDFVPAAAAAFAAAPDGVHDWRQLTVPDEALPPGAYRVVVGLYDPQTGARLDLLDENGAPIGQELTVATLQPAPPPTPDQACALIPATCGE
ncbi:MAG: hypothetical protein KDD83_26040, partial [Caldilineaceae bacterium]|nr:hypothetical protein [Caldilineaceae bacterium]